MKQKGIDYSTGLIWAAALVGMIRYAAAFLASDTGVIVGVTSDIITFMLGISGFAMGILSTFGTAYLFDGWRKKMPNNGAAWSFKFQILTIFVFAAFFFELVILVPFTVSRVSHGTMVSVLDTGFWLFFWSTAVNIMPLLLIGGVSVGNQIVTVDSGQVTGQVSETADTKTDSDRNLSGQNKKKSELTGQDLKLIAQMSSADIASAYGCDERTARRWRKSAQERTTPPFP